jgi:hypothetical protein
MPHASHPAKEKTEQKGRLGTSHQGPDGAANCRPQQNREGTETRRNRYPWRPS